MVCSKVEVCGENERLLIPDEKTTEREILKKKSENKFWNDIKCLESCSWKKIVSYGFWLTLLINNGIPINI